MEESKWKMQKHCHPELVEGRMSGVPRILNGRKEICNLFTCLRIVNTGECG